ncbi:hypothetical protein OY671_001636 [Metschnikowia pulcherrima]|nr:hypothetical protein OY671_001636 [Metschnikowia pulcherrima]
MPDYGHDSRFGSFVTPTAAAPQQAVALARSSEEVGSDLVTFQDHPYQAAFLDTWTSSSWVAARTERIRLAGNVLNSPSRPPAVSARAVASLDRLSGGRVELGLGAGGFWDPIVAMGGERLTPGQSVDALSEGIDVIRGSWDTTTRERSEVGGTYHHVDGAKRGPAPAHDVEIWVGALKPRMSRLVGAQADGWLPSLAYSQSFEALAQGNATIDAAAQEAGRDPSAVRRSLNVGGRFTADGGAGFLQGSPRQWAEQVAEVTLEHGVSTWIVGGDDPTTLAVVGQEVAPAARELVAAARGTADGPAPDPEATVGLARVAEDAGYDLVTFQDHPYQPRFLDTWTSSSYVASATERIHVAPDVVNVPMRPPAVSARAAASLDSLSDGRVELALGAGAFWDAMEAMGTRRLTPGESVDALAEAIEVIRAIWGEDGDGESFVPGRHHRLDGATPGPGTTRRIPSWSGALGPRMSRLVGEKADGWLPSSGRVGLDGSRAGNARIDEAAAAVGRDPREVTRSLNVSGTFDAVPEASGLGGAPDLSGPPEAWVERLSPLVLDEGVSTSVLATDDERTTRRFADEVAPASRDAVDAARAERGTDTSCVVPLAVRAARRDGIAYDDVPASLAERAVEPGDAAYAGVRSNYSRGGSPGLVSRPRDTAEVVEALAFARAQPVTRRVPSSVRSGGHGISGRSTNDGGIVLDLAALDQVEVLDDATRLVRVGPGARWGGVAAALAPRGWAITSGDSGGVGVGGLATAGGIGFLGRAHGSTIDHVRAVEVVLADGSVVRASDDENTDSFWAVRGAGAQVGIVTSFELVADEVSAVGFAQMVHDASDLAGFLERWGATVEASPRDTTSFSIVGRPRPGQPLVAQSMTMVDSDDPDSVLARLQPFAAIAPSLARATAQIVPYDAVVSAPPPGPHGGQGEPVSRSGSSEHLTPEASARLAGLVASGDTYFFQIRSTGGAASDVPADATAYAHRSANFSVVAMGASRSRLDARWDALADVFDGMYLSFDTDSRTERVTDAFPPATSERSREVKRRVDPTNVFRDNSPVLGPHPTDEPEPAVVPPR